MIRASNNDCECRDDNLLTRGDTHSAARNRQEQHDMRHVRNPVSEKRSNAQSDARRPTATSTSADSDIHIGRCAWTEGNRSPQGRAGERRPISSCFLYRRKQDFLNGQRPLFYRRGGWRHAPYDGGDGGDDTKENSFSDGRHRHPRQGEADSHRHGFLCLCHPLIDAINGG